MDLNNISILRQDLKKQLTNYKNKDITNVSTHITARLGSEGINKIESGKAINKSKNNGYTVLEHFMAASKIIEYFEAALLIHSSSDTKILNNPNIISIKRFVKETIINNKATDVLITVKESKAGHRIYSMELDKIKRASSRWQAID